MLSAVSYCLRLGQELLFQNGFLIEALKEIRLQGMPVLFGFKGLSYPAVSYL